jgi:hypothetical protein
MTQSLVNYYSIIEAQQQKWVQELARRIINFGVNGLPSAISASVYFSTQK